MNFFKITLVFVFFLSFDLISEEIKVIELHENNEILSQDEGSNEEINSDIANEDENDVANEDENKKIIAISNENENLNNTNNEVENNKDENNYDDKTSVSTLSIWQKSNKEDLDFLFSKINTSKSKVINKYLVDSLTEFSKAPESFDQAEFDNLRIKSLIRMGQRSAALKVLNNISSYDSYSNYYNSLKLDFYLTSNQLSEACSFNDSLKENNNDQENITLRISIFCSFLENKIEEADFLNSLLLDSQDNDQFFQKIYFNLKNNIDDPIDFSKGSFDESSFALYSAMIRIGNLSFNEKFLEFDSANLTLPIILSSSTNISLRLKSAHKAYELGLFSAESLSALYQSVDFSSEQLFSLNKTLEQYVLEPEMGMALLFQNASIQLLPITKFESLKIFWDYAIKNNFEKQSYKLSKNLIESTVPSVELSDYAILIAKAHIYNKNFLQAEKWITFIENFNSQSNELSQIELGNLKFLFNLHKSEDRDSYIKNLENNLMHKLEKEISFDDYTETLKTTFEIILNDKILANQIIVERKIIDERSMPSSYIINNINNSAENEKIGELILTVLVSLENKLWQEIHPQHLKILLESFKKAKLDDLINDLIIEIFEESKII